MKRPSVAIFAAAWACLSACGLDLDPPAKVIHARFDPDAKVIPMPTDVLRDGVAGKLDIPIDDTLTPAEKSLYTVMNTQDGWSSAMSATVEFDGPIDRTTINADTVQVWHWRATPARVDDVRIAISDDEQKLTIDPPRTGWERGERYAIVVRGGAAGVEGKAGEKVECDAAFYFLRQTERLDTPAHEHAFPGNTAAERQDNARKLEEIRADLAPVFDFAAGEGLARENVAALWTFTVTQRTELAMDKASQRMPLPIDVLQGPPTPATSTSPLAPWDTADRGSTPRPGSRSFDWLRHVGHPDVPSSRARSIRRRSRRRRSRSGRSRAAPAPCPASSRLASSCSPIRRASRSRPWPSRSTRARASPWSCARA